MDTCILCGGSLTDPDHETIVLKRKDGVKTCNTFAEKRKLNITFKVCSSLPFTALIVLGLITGTMF